MAHHLSAPTPAHPAGSSCLLIPIHCIYLHLKALSRQDLGLLLHFGGTLRIQLVMLWQRWNEIRNKDEKIVTRLKKLMVMIAIPQGETGGRRKLLKGRWPRELDLCAILGLPSTVQGGKVPLAYYNMQKRWNVIMTLLTQRLSPWHRADIWPLFPETGFHSSVSTIPWTGADI